MTTPPKPPGAPKPAYWKETIHNSNRRAPWHDYRSRCIYMVTFTKRKGCPAFSDARLAEGGAAQLTLYPAGEIINEEIRKTPAFHPRLEIMESVVMPDHVHFLVFVKTRVEKHLGEIVQAIKAASTRRIRNLLGDAALAVFDEGFNDQILRPSRSLDTLIDYIRQNPFRLAVRKACPDFFTRRDDIVVAGTPCQAYGNIQLLDNPFKAQVIVHRADTPEDFERAKAVWLYTAANGGVLVSPFISKREKAVRDEAGKLGSRFIIIKERPFAEREKPSAREFALCTAGTLLIIAPRQPLEFSRAACRQMNLLAEAVAAL